MTPRSGQRSEVPNVSILLWCSGGVNLCIVVKARLFPVVWPGIGLLTGVEMDHGSSDPAIFSSRLGFCGIREKRRVQHLWLITTACRLGSHLK